MRQMIAALALVALACGGDKGGQPQSAPAGEAAQPSAAPAATGTGTVHEVSMELKDGKYVFIPVTLTIKPGDTVKWINTSGGPHNVAFFKDKIPAGAAEVLNAAMPNKMQDLAGPFLIEEKAAYEVSFINAPAGQYSYTCQPHEMLGMNATLTVQP